MSRLPSPQPERSSGSPARPTVPAQQSAPAPPEEIDVTILDNRVPLAAKRPANGRAAQHPAGTPAANGRPAGTAVAPPPPAAAPAAPSAPAAAPEAKRAAGLSRNPVQRLEALFDPASLRLLL